MPLGAVEVVTDVGPLYFPADDQVMRPLIERTGDWELDEATLFRTLIPRGGTVVDVGAHVGYYTLLAAAIVGRRGQVVAIEPHPFNAKLLRANVFRNRRSRIVRVIEAAAWRNSGRLALAENREHNSADHRIASTGPDTLPVDAVTLDDLLAKRSQVDVLKVDAQGSDHVALEGAARTLRRCRPVVFVEFWPTGIRARGDDPADVIRFYRSFGGRLTMPGIQLAFDDATAEHLVEIADALPGGFATLILRHT
jgi:FkbM family methyltransferase